MRAVPDAPSVAGAQEGFLPAAADPLPVDSFWDVEVAEGLED